MAKIRLGFIGVGGIATGRHIPTFRTFDDVEITAVQDVNAERAMKVANELNIPEVCSTIEDMYPHVDAVVVSTPNKYHAPISIDAMNNGKHVLCEKPMAMSTEECNAMIEAEERNGVKLHIAYHYRFMKEAIAAKKIIERGTIGDPLVVRVKGLRRRKVPGWGVFTNQELQGGRRIDRLWLPSTRPGNVSHGRRETCGSIKFDLQSAESYKYGQRMGPLQPGFL